MSEFKSTSPALRLLCSALLLSASTLASTAIAADDADPQTQETPPAASTDTASGTADLQTPAAAPKKLPSGEAALPKAEPDYYAERAKKMVGAESNSKIREHALQKQFPDQNVVVCEAGCPSGKSDQIMFMEPKSARKSQKSAEMIPSAGGPGAAAGLDITCEAGCYDSMPKSYHSLPGAAINTALKGVTPGNTAANSASWVTTIARADEASVQKPKTAAASGDWMKRIDQQAMKPADVAKVESPATPAPVQAVAVAAAEMKTPEKPDDLASAPIDVPAVEPAPAKPDVIAAADPAPAAPAASVESSAPANSMKMPAVPVADPAATPDTAANATMPPVEEKPPVEAAPAGPAELAAAPAIADELPPPPAAPAIAVPAPLNAAPAVEPPAVAAEAAVPAAPAEDAPVTAQNEVIDEGGDLKQAGEMAKALDDAKATAEKAEAISQAAPAAIANAAVPAADVAAPIAAAPASPAVATAPSSEAEAAPTFTADQPKIVSGPAPTETMQADKPAVVAEVTPDQAPSGKSASHNDAVINVETGDPDMNAAISKARLTLPEFWSKLDAPASGETDFSLKVAIEGANKGEVEHFWLTNIMRKDGKIVGIISNDPETVKTVTRGQSYEIKPEKISDWLYKRNGKMVGNETMRPLLKRLPPQQAAAYRGMYETP